MIDKIWSGRSPLYLILLPLSGLYGLITWLIRLSYRMGWRKSWRSPVPVVVVGNLTVGGNGKTPVVIWLTEMLQKAGLRVGVVSRGYGGKAPYYPLILNQMTSPDQAGDEPVLIYQRTGVSVAVSPVRSEAVKALLAQTELDVIIADDGLQHYALQRDVEIVVVDGTRRFGNGWWLPAGPLRERAGRLRSVDAVIVNGGEAQGEEITMTLQPGAAINLLSQHRRPPEQFKQVVAMAGIGHPPRFFNMLRQLNVNVVKTLPFADHSHYQHDQLKALISQQQILMMTEKDAVKCRSFAEPDWWYLPVNACLSSPGAERLLDKIKRCCLQTQPESPVNHQAE